MAAEAQPDLRLELIYNDSVRSLTDQAGILDGLRTRTGMLLAATSIASSFLGGAALNQHDLTVLSVLAIAALLAVGGLCVAVLWPRSDAWHFTHDTNKLLEGYVDAGKSIDETRRLIARKNCELYGINKALLDPMFGYFRWACLALGVEVALWLLDLGTRG